MMMKLDLYLMNWILYVYMHILKNIHTSYKNKKIQRTVKKKILTFNNKDRDN